MKRTFRPKGMLFFAAVAIVAVLAGRYDLEISRYFHNPDSILGIWMHRIGEWPNSLALIFSGIVLYGGRDRWRVNPIRNVVYTLPVFIGTGILILWTWRYTVGQFPNLWIAIPAILAIGLLLIRILGSGDPNQYRKLRGIALAALWMALFAIVSVNVFKLFWGRVRYEGMLPGFEAFTPWYLPQGITGNYSFPSGHVANACTSLILWLFAKRAQSRGAAVALWLIPVGWIALTAVGRIVSGAHFVSDVLASLLLCTLSYQVCSHNAMIDSVRR